MTTLQNASGIRLAALGRRAACSSYTLVVETKTLFTITGTVLLTSFQGLVGTAITVANTVTIQANPTTGTSSVLAIATDLGTTDTPAGNYVTLPPLPAGSLIFGIGAARSSPQIILGAGTIEQVTATGADGAVVWSLTYVPITDDGTITAAF